MESILLALMLLFAPYAPAHELQPYAAHLARATMSPEVLSELFVTGRYEGLWGQRGVPMGVTAWMASHGHRPDAHEAVCASLASVEAAYANCGGGARNLSRRLGFYITGRCEVNPAQEVMTRARSVRAMTRIFRAFVRDERQEMLTCPSGE